MPAEESGHYSQNGHPLVELALYGKPENSLFVSPMMVDTGCSHKLLIYKNWADQVGLPETHEISSCTMVNGAKLVGYMTWGYVKWFGQITLTEIFVCPVAESHNPRIKREYVGIIGMGLLRETNIHLKGSSVTIAKSGGA